MKMPQAGAGKFANLFVHTAMANGIEEDLAEVFGRLPARLTIPKCAAFDTCTRNGPPGDLVWYNTKQGYALPGKITEVDSASSTAWVQSNDKKEEIAEFHFNDLQKRASDAMCFEDLVQLDDLCNPAVLWALKTRFEYGKTYTYIGEMLISINPYRHLDVYGPEIMEQYRKKMTTSLPSHVYGFAEMVQRRLYAFDTSQWIIATGITGSGKTELCKLMVQYFAEGCKREMKEAAFNDKLYHAMHILQSFLNAKTAANDNSTRGGKIYSLQYQNKKLIGAKVACCLLEKTRLVSHVKGERNFHIFYEMIAGLKQQTRQSFGLNTPENFFYLNQGKCVKLSSREENNFELLENALEIIKITLDQRHYIFRLLSAILHLGNIYFEEQTEDGNRKLVIANPNEVQWVAYLLQMDPDEITHRLTTKVIESRDQKVVHALTLDRALDIRDAIAKELYVGLIRWIIMKINKQLCDTGDDCNEINILDLYGFECFKVNFFEQLCINYINERVQRLFVRVQFCSEQMEYIREDVVWDRNVGANLLNNSIFNILAKQPNGILSLLDDECSFPKGSDESFLIKCQNNYDDNPLFTAKTKRQPGFAVQHFFGHARYNVLGFVDKNREVHSAQTVEFLLESQNILIAQMFEKQKLALSKRKEESENFDTYRIRAPTFAMQLHEEFNQLTKRIEKYMVHFVRCINPNKAKEADVLDMQFVLEQIKCLGLTEVLHMQKFGFTIKMKFRDFLVRYGCLKPETATVETKDEKNMCLYILTSLAHQYFQDFRIGKTKVFMKDIVAEHLDSILSERLSSSVIIIQKYCRGLLARRKFHHLYDWITHLQAIVRGSQARKKFSLIKAKVAEEAQQYAKQSRNLEVFRELSIKPNSQDSNANLQQRNSCAIVSVNHLEMPQNLAEMLLTTTNLDADKNIVRADRLIASHHEQEFILPHDLHEYSFNRYAQQHFKNHTWQMRRDPINTPFLHKDSEAEMQLSLTLFRLILRYMNDTSLSSSQEIILSNYIIQKGIDNKNLRDEIYAQVINQIHGNPNQANAERGWRLLGLCASAFPPTDAMFKYALNYVMNADCDGFKNLLKTKLLQSIHDNNTTMRRYPPCILEHKAVRSKAKMALLSYLSDGSKVGSQIDSWTKAEEFAELAMKNGGISECTGWTVSLECQDAVIRLNGNQYLLDVLSYIELPQLFPAQKSDYLITMKQHKKPHLEPSTIQERLEALERRPNLRTLISDDFYSSKLKKGGSIRSLIHKARLQHGEKLDSASVKQEWLNWNEKCAAQNKMRPGHLNLDHDGSVTNNARCQSRMSSNSYQTDHSILTADTSNQTRPPSSVNTLRSSKFCETSNPLVDENQRKTFSWSRTSTRPEAPALANNLSSQGEQRENKQNCQNYDKENVDKKNSIPAEQSVIQDIAYMSINRRPISNYSSLSSHFRGISIPGRNSEVDEFLDQLFNPVTVLGNMNDPKSLAATIKGGGDESDNKNQPVAVEQAQTMYSSLYSFIPQYASPVFMMMPYDAARMFMPNQRDSQVQGMQQFSNVKAQGNFNADQANVLMPVPLVPVSFGSYMQANSIGQEAFKGPSNMLPLSMNQNFSPNYRLQEYQHPLPPNGVGSDVMYTSFNPHVVNPNSTDEPCVHENNFNNDLSNKVKEEMTSLSEAGSFFPNSSQLWKGRDAMKSKNEDDSNQKLFYQWEQISKSDAAAKCKPLSTPTKTLIEEETRSLLSRDSFASRDIINRNNTKSVASLDASKEHENIDNSNYSTLTTSENKIHQKESGNMKTLSREHLYGNLTYDSENRWINPCENVYQTEDDRCRSNTPTAYRLEQPQLTNAESFDTLPVLHRDATGEFGYGNRVPMRDGLMKIPPSICSTLTRESRIDSRPSFKTQDYFSSTLVGLKEKRRGPALTYGNVAWKLMIRKELFFPNDSLQDPAALDAVFYQIVRDTFNEKDSFRLEKAERNQMIRLLTSNGIELETLTSANISPSFKKHVVQIARSWPLYFCRLYPVTVSSNFGEDRPHYVGISESGIWLIDRQGEGSDEALRIVECYEYAFTTKLIVFEDIDHTEATENEFLLSTVNGVIIRVSTKSGEEITNLANKYMFGPNQGKEYVRATADYITEEPNLLSFRKGDIIQLVKTMPDAHPGSGWLYGKINTKYGFFPKEHLDPISDSEEEAEEEDDDDENEEQASEVPNGLEASNQMTPTSPPPVSAHSTQDKLTMMEFAMLHFREAQKYESTQNSTLTTLKRKSKKEWTWKDVADLVKFTKSPIQNPLLKLDKGDVGKLAVDCFLNLMMYMGDYPLKKDNNYLDCVYKIMAACREHPILRDEVYCQVIKQITNNKSSKPDSALMGWRMLSILTAYFDSSDVFRPYLQKYLSDSASDNRRAYHGTAMECFQNFRQTLQFGGRRFILSPQELESISQGKNLKRQVYHLPGGTKKVINTKSVTVVEEIIKELCIDLNVRSSLEQQEFSLCVVIESDNVMRILSNDEYILDITSELEEMKREYFLLLKRIVWMHPLRKDSELYTDIMFFQVLPDYIEGLLVVMRGPDSVSAATMDDIATLGALLACADDDWDGQMVTTRDIVHLLPKTVHNIRHVTLELWTDRINQKLRQLSSKTLPIVARAKFLGIQLPILCAFWFCYFFSIVDLLQTWPLFGSTFFYIPSVSDPRAKGECLMALNRHGVQFLDMHTHEVLFEFRLNEILSTQKSYPDGTASMNQQSAVEHMDIKIGNMLQQHVVTLRTDQGAEISRLFGQYIYVDSQSRGLLGIEGKH
ncbi:Unconventional myosin-XV [Trichinella sp. T9]|nr:Unconventional myosin-XV [Trichinella sp. T9]